MTTALAVRKDQLLLGYVNQIYVVSIYYKAASNTQEIADRFTQLVTYKVLDLSELQADQSGSAVLCHDIGVIPFR